MKVKSVERLPQSSESLYDLSVEKTHTYTVGEPLETGVPSGSI